MTLNEEKANSLFRAIETDLTKVLRDELSDQSLWNATVFNEATERMRRDPRSSIGNRSFIDYLFWQQKLEAVSANAEYLEMTPHGNAFVSNIDELLGLHGLRNDLAHPRALQDSDLDTILKISISIVQSGCTEGQIVESLSRLEVAPKRASSPTPLVLNNLPPAEYDDTGFVGRHSLISSLVREIKTKTPLHSMIWLTGVGGSGKTAIAREIASRLLFDPDQPFETILWVSFKTEELGAFGPTVIRDSIKSASLALMETELSQLDEHATLTEIFKELGTLETLIIFDNCETYPGDIQEIVKADPPSTIKFLFTSRRTGEFGRSVPIPPLTPDECKFFLSRLQKTYSSDSILGILKNQGQFGLVLGALGLYPLALKWMARAFNSGSTLEEVLKNKDVVLRYCIENVYQSLTENSKQLLHYLFVSRTSLSVGDMKVILESRATDEILHNLSELTRAGLVLQENRELKRTYVVDGQARDFLLITGALSVDQRKNLLKELKKHYKGTSSQNWFDNYSPYIVADTDIEPLVASRLKLLLKPHHQSDLTNEQKIQIATELAESSPNYWETHRVLGELYSWLGDSTRSIELHKRALGLCPRDRSSSLSRINYLLGLKLSEEDDIEALRAHQNAVKHRQTNVTLLALSRSLMYLNRFDEAEKVTEDAMQFAEGSHQIFFTHHVTFQILKRRCEVLQGGERTNAALNAINFWLTTTQLTFDCHPKFLPAIIDEVVDCIEFLLLSSEQGSSSSSVESKLPTELRSIARIDGVLSRLQVNDWPRRLERPGRSFLIQFAKWAEPLMEADPEFASRVRVALESEGLSPLPLTKGRVKVWYAERLYGFIKAKVDGTEIEAYFNLDLLQNRSRDAEKLRDRPEVEGYLARGDEGRLFMRQVRIVS